MAPFSVGRFPLGLLCVVLLLGASGMSQALVGKSLPGVPASISCPTRIENQAPSVTTTTTDNSCGLRLEYVGVYNSEGRFEPLSQPNRWYSQPSNGNTSPQVNRLGMRPEEVPPFLKLLPTERVVDDFPSTYHARKLARGPSHLGSILNSFVTFAYGNERPLLAPQHVTTDSRGRAIIADPKIPGIHVLDGKNSFRIVGGPHRRLQKPAGIAVDADDNIYIADSNLGLVLVYDPLGRFLRSIGRIDENETMLHRPAGIAIDCKQKRLYVADALRERVFIFDLQGQPLDRIGARGGEQGTITFEYPTEIALNGDQIVVLDQGGARVQITDVDGHLLKSFMVSGPDPLHKVERGLGVDANRHIYVSNVLSSTVKIYDQDGRLLGTLMAGGPYNIGFKSPEGVWINRENQMFIADTGNHQIQVFRVAAIESAQVTD